MRENEIPKLLKEAIVKDNLVIFVGSGLSKRFDLPTWKILVRDVIDKIDLEDYKLFLPLLEKGLMSPIDVLEKLKKEHNEIKRYIKEKFHIQNGDFCLHAKLIELSGQIITTNYDNAFEKASNDTIVPTAYTSTFNISEINKNGTAYIFKLHGSYSEPDHCIVFKQDYENLYSKNTAAKEKLKAIFSEKTILFIGFSFADPFLDLLFNTQDSIFENNNRHFILAEDSKYFKQIKYLQVIDIDDFNEVDLYIDKCLQYKRQNCEKSTLENILVEKKLNSKPRIAFLFPNPIDINLSEELAKVQGYFDSIEVEFIVGILNIKTLLMVEEFDAVIILTKVFKSNLYIEDDNLKSALISVSEICDAIPNEKIPIIFITNEKIEPEIDRPIINISSFKHAAINKFIYKCLKECDIEFQDDNIGIYLKSLIKNSILKGANQISSIYNNNKDLEIGKKSLTNIVGRIEEQSAIALKLISIKKTNKLLNIKASGGTGKTVLIKKVAYELYNRGYFKDGVIFKSCENIKNFADFEELLISGFCLTNILNFKDYVLS